RASCCGTSRRPGKRRVSGRSWPPGPSRRSTWPPRRREPSRIVSGGGRPTPGLWRKRLYEYHLKRPAASARRRFIWFLNHGFLLSESRFFVCAAQVLTYDTSQKGIARVPGESTDHGRVGSEWANGRQAWPRSARGHASPRLRRRRLARVQEQHQRRRRRPGV